MPLKFGILLLGFSMLIGELIRQFRIRRDVKLRQVPLSCGLSGGEFARLLLRLQGLEDVKVVESRHLVTDHYVPGAKVLRLAPQNFHGVNLAAAGLAAHEVGHAIQEEAGYRPLTWRQTVIRLTYYGSFGVFLVCIPLIVFERPLGLLLLGICWMFIRANNLLTLPAEFNASIRVKELIRRTRLLPLGREFNQLDEMMRAAELDKVSGFLKTIHYLASWIVPWRRR
ncbi:MAG: zinc metallopeptidase [Verrucomicrobiales bacterium]